jgi:putative ABC transport system ATP-binding protein
MTPTVHVQLETGEQLFGQGDIGDRIYRVESGQISLTRDGAQVATAGPGEIFGEMGPVFSLTRSAAAVATEPTSLTGYTVDAFRSEFGGDTLRQLVGRWG